MRIHSSDFDYYDVCLKFSTDPEPVYIRNPNQVIFKSHGHKTIPLWNHYNTYGMIFFCGNYYPFVKFETIYKQATYCYSIEDCDRYLQSILKEDAYNVYFKSDWSKKYVQTDLVRRNRIISVFSETKEVYYTTSNPFLDMKEAIDKHRNANHPIVTLLYSAYSCYITTDGNLSIFNFQKVLNAYQAFSKIESWCCNIARPENPIIEVDDKSLAISKGFDKWSFRKPGKNSK